MSNSRRQRRDHQQNWSVFTDKPYFTDGKNPVVQLPSQQYGKGDPKLHEELAKDRHWILDQNYLRIRRIATRLPGRFVFVWWIAKMLWEQLWAILRQGGITSSGGRLVVSLP